MLSTKSTQNHIPINTMEDGAFAALLAARRAKLEMGGAYHYSRLIDQYSWEAFLNLRIQISPFVNL